ncbi:RNA polymerase sigma factor [Spongiactinospora sp. TRM90649]|uniref:RNA polymerase sigma factor n=1 Tax=Spongiactinospora sp. TRM90649 TaxID=3031114 RepID=UPI0023F89C80|nr:RNA polymerase sigma factor [Spongiactinospora sp. TRM90649]MDF5752864.1 RNA polymerase sigma factor [Spongiactinospora sp. TRM90649]
MQFKQTGTAPFGRDPAAFEAFYERHFDDVTRFLARRVIDPGSVADLTAEVFLAVLDSAHTYRPGKGSEIAWLYGVARNTLLAERRRSVRERRANDRLAGRRLLAADDIARLEERIDAERPARLAIERMAELPEKDRALLELVAIDGLSTVEAAAALGIRQGTARVRLHRARRSIQRVPGLVNAIGGTK